MVGVGPGGVESALARVAIVNGRGDAVLDTFVRPQEAVTDYRTKFSGVRPADLVDAPLFADVQRQVADMLKSRILVGHGLENDLAALLFHHPTRMTRDTARYAPLMRAPGVPHALRFLAQRELGVKIQHAEHSPVEDARAALFIYQMHRKEWVSEATSFQMTTF